jgi:hypothetical protein
LSTNPFDRQGTIGRHDKVTDAQVFDGRFALGHPNQRSSSETIGTSSAVTAVSTVTVAVDASGKCAPRIGIFDLEDGRDHGR